MGDLGQMVRLPKFDIRDDAAVAHAVHKSNVVINLIGADIDTWNWKLEEVHQDIPSRIANICAASGNVERFIHFSAAGASPDATSRRLRSKAVGEELVRSIIPTATILRPGPLVGDEDRFTRRLARMVRMHGPTMPLVEGGTQLVAPTFVGDVAEATLKALNHAGAKGETYDLVGPQVYEMRQILEVVCGILREPFEYVHRFRSDPRTKVMAAVQSRLSQVAPIPFYNAWYTEDLLNEVDTDLVASPTAGSYDDLRHVPRHIEDGLILDQIRHMRKGGYGEGSLKTPPPEEEAYSGPLGFAKTRYPGLNNGSTLDTW